MLLAGAVGAVVVAAAPWSRMFESSLGQWAMYMWAAFDIVLISGAVAATGGGRSEVWCVYALTTLFFAASYPPRGQIALLGLTAAGYLAAIEMTGRDVTAASLLLRVSLLLIVFLMARFLARELRVEIELRGEAALRAQLAETEARRTQWFRALVQDSADVVTSFDVEGQILYMSGAAREFGYDPESLVGTNVRDLVHPDDVERVVEQITEQFETGSRPTPIEYRIHCADGSWRYAEGIATNLLDEPTINAVVVNARDVTPREAGRDPGVESEPGAQPDRGGRAHRRGARSRDLDRRRAHRRTLHDRGERSRRRRLGRGTRRSRRVRVLAGDLAERR